MLALLLIILGVYLFSAAATEFTKTSTKEPNWLTWSIQATLAGLFFIFAGVAVIALSRSLQIQFPYFSSVLIIPGTTLLAMSASFLTLAFYRSTPELKGLLLSLLGGLSLICGFSVYFSPLRWSGFFREFLLFDADEFALALGFTFIVFLIFKLDLKSFAYSGDLTATNKEQDPRRWRLYLLISVGSILFLALLLKPYLPSLLSRTTNLRTPWFEVSLKSSDQQFRASTKDLYDNATLMGVDSLYAYMVDVVTMMVFRREVERVSSGADSIEIKNLDQQIDNHKLFRFFLDDSAFFNFLKRYFSEKDENNLQQLKLESLCWARLMENLVSKSQRPNEYKEECSKVPNVKSIDSFKDYDFSDLRKNPVYSLAQANLFWFSGKTSSALDTLKQAINQNGYGIQRYLLRELKSYVILARFENSIREDIEKATNIWETALSDILEEKKIAEKFFRYDKEKRINWMNITEIRRKGAERIRSRLELHEFRLKNILADFYARQKIREGLAISYIDDLNQKMDEDRQSRNAIWLDTVAYVKLRFLSEDYKEVKKAILLLEEAEYLAKSKFRGGDKVYYLNIIRSHLDTARLLL